MKRFVVQLLAAVGLVTVSLGADTQPPAIQSVSPNPASTLAALSQVSVTFNEVVLGVEAEDLLINGEPAVALAVFGNTYTFTCSAPAPGFVSVYFDVDHGITDQSGNRFDESAQGANWFYNLVDSVPPVAVRLAPPNGAVVRALTGVEVLFSELVSEVTQGDLLINGIAATNVTGSGVGPYRFSFAPPPAGAVTFSWAGGHGIQDMASNAFAGANWTVTLNNAAAATVRINELLAANESSTGLRDEDNELQDWIELFNYGTQPVNLAGWSLTNDPDQPRQWMFPAISLNPGQYLIVFASGKDRSNPNFGARQHANFQLSSAGEYLALMTSDEPAIPASSLTYPEQRVDHSYGHDPSAQLRYFSAPTPATANGSSTIQGIVSPVHFSVSRGFFNAPFNLVLSTITPGATIRYTLDGSHPTAISGFVYTGPIAISNTAPVRAAGFRADALPSNVRTHTYLFPDQVLRQPSNPAGFPSSWITQNGSVIVPADYAMDSRIINGPAYTNLARQALTSIPTLSVVMRTGDLFSQANGIYSNPRGTGLAWERPASAEFIFTDGKDPVQIDAGYRIQGGSSREENKSHKHSQRLLFRGAYGAGRLDHRLFEDSPVDSFDTLVIDAGLNLVWIHRTDSTQRRQAQYVRDQFVSDLQNAMGWPAFHGRFFHLYLNGLYWGLHGIHERPEEDFAASYFGGDENQWDILKNTTAFEVLSGDLTAWNAMRNLANSGLANDAQYQQIQQYLDVRSLIDYMILNIYTGNTDWPHHNWYVARRRQPTGTFKFFSWDAEHVLKEASYDNSGVANANTPAEFYDQLRRNNSEFRLLFADHVHKHFFNGGLCTTNESRARYLARIREIDPAIVLESARWGDNAGNAERPGQPYERNIEWQNELNRLLNSWFPQRSGIVFNQFRALGLYPAVTAPSFNQHGGRAPRGFNLSMSAPAGSIYFTTNGVDPRVPLAGTPAPDARLYSGPVSLSRSTVVKARALVGTNWSALNEASFIVEQLTVPLRITEIMYNPPGGDAYEFLELRNVGTTSIDISGYSFGGITYVFPPGSILSAGQTIVLASDANPAAFGARYPGVVVFGYFADRLANGGERLTIKDRVGETIISVDYQDAGQWPQSADGFGHSLEILEPLDDPDAPANWRASAIQLGSPGLTPPAPGLSIIRINELMALNLGAVSNAGTFPDWIELHNAGATNVDLTGWSLSDDSNPRRFVFPVGSSIGPGGYLVLWCDGQTNLPGLHTGFSLDVDGETVFLFDPLTNRLDAISLGNQLGNYTAGRIAEDWQLCIPTPGMANTLAATASQTNLVINEWLANAPPGGSDWIELFNSSSNAPIDLRQIYLGTSNALFQLQAVSFLAPRGYIQLLADELPGFAHLDFKLPAAAGAIAVFDAAGVLVNRVTYGSQSENLSQGRLPDGSASIQSFPGSASPGAPNYIISYSGPFLNEVMARNLGAVTMSNGLAADWIELRNPASTNFDLSGMRLSIDAFDPTQWTFPFGTSIPAGGYLIVWCTSERPASAVFEAELNTGHAIDAQNGSVHLFNAQGQMVDRVEFGFQINNQTIGRSSGVWRLLATPTPGAANSAEAPLGPPTALAINEWMATPASSDDWFELYNGSSMPVSLSGLFLTDDPSIFGLTNFTIAPLSYIGPENWVRFLADSDPSQGRDHVNFVLDDFGETIRLYSTNLQLIDAVDFGLSQPDVSEGRLPDGSLQIVRFPGSPSPAAANYLALPSVVINEILVNPSGGMEQAVELYNPTSKAVDISHWWLSDSPATPHKFRIPAETILPAGGFQVFYAVQFAPPGSTNPLVFPTGGGLVMLSEADEAGNLSGARASASYGSSFPGQPYGRVPCADPPFARLATATFGVDFPASVEEFRSGTGAVNSRHALGEEEPVGAPFIVAQPLSRTVPPGSTVILYADACGANPLSYQWFFNSSPVPNGTNGVLQLSNVQGSQTGDYFVVIANSLGAATSSVAHISLSALPAITVHPMDRRTNTGNSVSFTVVAQGTGLGYQWRFNAALIPGATNATFTIPSLTLADSGDYSVVVSNVAGTIASDAAHLVVTPSLQITTQPQSLSVLPGTNVSFSVAAVGSGPLRYQWFFESNAIAEATASTLALANVQLVNHGVYFAEVSDDNGAARSQPATLIVRVPPSIYQHPVSMTVGEGTDVTFFVGATGTPPLGYRWRRNGINLITKVGDPTYTITNVQTSHAGTYAVVITNLVNPVPGIISTNVTLTVLARPSLIQPRLLGNGDVEMFLRATTGRTYAVEISTDLLNWSGFAVFTPTNADTRVIDATPPAPRFYRARLIP